MLNLRVEDTVRFFIFYFERGSADILFWGSDDTCTQAGYWSAVADFIKSLGSASDKEKEKEKPARRSPSPSL